MNSKEEVELPIPRHIVGILIIIKTFKLFLHLTKQNYYYITCLFILQKAHTDSSFQKIAQKIAFCVYHKAKFSWDLKFKTIKDSKN